MIKWFDQKDFRVPNCSYINHFMHLWDLQKKTSQADPKL